MNESINKGMNRCHVSVRAKESTINPKPDSQAVERVSDRGNEGTHGSRL